MKRLSILTVAALLLLGSFSIAPAGVDIPGGTNRVSFGDVSGLDGATKFTVMTWVKLRALTANGGIFWKGNATVTLGLRMQNGDTSKLEGMVQFLQEGETPSGTAIVGEWAHYAMVYAGDAVGANNTQRLQIYKNCNLQTLTYSGTVPATAPDSLTDQLQLGYNESLNTAANAIFANFKVFAGMAMAKEQICAEMNLTRGMDMKDAAVIAPGKETSGRMIDYSGRGNHGTYSGVTFSPEMPPVTGGD